MRNLVVATVLTLCFGSCFAQSVDSKPTEPMLIGDVFLLDPSTQALKPLPSEDWKDVTTHMGMMSSGYMHSAQLSGDQSAFRVRADAKTEFVFKVGNPESVTLYPCVQKKQQRLANYAKDQLKANWTSDRTPIPGLPVGITQFGESAFKMTPKSPLLPGEYVVVTATKMFTFGIVK